MIIIIIETCWPANRPRVGEASTYANFHRQILLHVQIFSASTEKFPFLSLQ